MADLRGYVSEHLGDPDAVLVYFETVFSSARAWSCVIASISGSGCWSGHGGDWNATTHCATRWVLRLARGRRKNAAGPVFGVRQRVRPPKCLRGSGIR